MILYLDASALVKAFLEEEGSDEVLDLLVEPAVSSTSVISFIECHAAFARSRREKRLSTAQTSAAVRRFDELWLDLATVDLDVTMARRAGRLAHDHALRAGDCIHLASAQAMAQGAADGVRFVCWDRRLWVAASQLGFPVAPNDLPE